LSKIYALVENKKIIKCSFLVFSFKKKIYFSETNSPFKFIQNNNKKKMSASKSHTDGASQNSNSGTPSFCPTYDQMIATQLSRNDLVQLISNPTVAQQVIPGFYIRVLIELSTGAEDYRAYTIRRLVTGRQYSGFSNDRNATTTYYLELNTPALLDNLAADAANGINSQQQTSNFQIVTTGNSNTSFQLNCISNSKISQQEYDTWVSEVPTDPVRFEGLQGYNDRKNRQIQLMPNLQGPNIRRNRPQGNSQGAADNNNNNNNSISAPASNGNNNNNGGGVSPSAADAAGINLPSKGNNNNNAAGNLGRTVTIGNLMQTTAGGNATRRGAQNNNNSNNNNNAGGADTDQDAAPISQQLEEQLLAAYKRNHVEELREKHQVFIDPKLYPTTKLSILRTMESDLGDYIDKLREVVQQKKPTCVVCMTKIPSVVFLPCRHMALCRSCAVDLVQAKCPLCRETIVELWEPEEDL
jgi:hypothetical protein